MWRAWFSHQRLARTSPPLPCSPARGRAGVRRRSLRSLPETTCRQRTSFIHATKPGLAVMPLCPSNRRFFGENKFSPVTRAPHGVAAAKSSSTVESSARHFFGRPGPCKSGKQRALTWKDFIQRYFLNDSGPGNFAPTPSARIPRCWDAAPGPREPVAALRAAPLAQGRTRSCA